MTIEAFQYYYFALFQVTIHPALLALYQCLFTVAIHGVLDWNQLCIKTC